MPHLCIDSSFWTSPIHQQTLIKSLDIKVIHITASGKRENLGQTNFAPVFDTGNDHALHKRSIDLRLKTESREHDLGTLTLKYSAILENLSFEH